MAPKDQRDALAAARQTASWRKWAFIAMLVAFLFGFQEICFRLVFVLPEAPSFNRILYTPLASLPGESGLQTRLISNVRIVWESEPDGFRFEHRLNLYGFRTPDFTLNPLPNRPRVLFIGDSFTEGFGARDDETIAAQFADSIEPTVAVEAINLGVGATGFAEYVRLVRDSVHMLKPTVVFLVVFANDLPAPPLDAKSVPKPPRFTRFSGWRPRLYDLWRRWRRGGLPLRYHRGPYRFFPPVPSPANPLSQIAPPANADPNLVDAMRRGRLNPCLIRSLPHFATVLQHDYEASGGVGSHVGYLARLCRNGNARLVLVYVPYHAAVSQRYLSAHRRLGGPGVDSITSLMEPRYRRQQNHLRRVAKTLRLPLLDLTDAFIAAEQAGARLYWPIDCHCNAQGYALIARACVQWWRKQRPAAGPLPLLASDAPTCFAKRSR